MTDLPSWGWCIATYNRHDMLEQSCALALSQSVPPSEIVVTDASADWERGRDRIERVIEAAVAAGRARPRFSYEQASKASSAAQRNESIMRSQADILFLFDDDTLMFEDTAARILEVYARDTDHLVQAVTARNVAARPSEPGWTASADAPAPSPPSSPASISELRSTDDAGPKQVRTSLVSAIRALLRADDRFVPYDPKPPAHPVPAGLEGLDLRSWKLAAGFHLTVRREAVLREPFEARLKGYSPGEDSDLTYRLTRHGPILHRPDARIHHAEAEGERFGIFRRTALGALNPLLLHRVHSSDRAFSRRENRALLRRRLLIEFAKDTRDMDWRLPRTRGIAEALRHVDEILSAGDDEIDAVFERFQSL
jgi:GT2 family glycosyltransferase